MVILTIWWHFMLGGLTWAPHIFGGAYVARRRLVGKESDIKQTLPLLVKRRKSDIWSIFPKGVNLAPTSNSNWELQKGQNWTWMKALEEENKRRKHVTSGGIHTFFPTFPKIPLLSLTTLIWPKPILTPKNPYMAELLPIFDSSSRPKWSSLTHLNTSHKYLLSSLSIYHFPCFTFSHQNPSALFSFFSFRDSSAPIASIFTILILSSSMLLG